MDLLRLLDASASTVRGSIAQGSVSPGGFAQLLEKAELGVVRSGRAVSVDGAAGIDLSLEQLDRIAEAADRAEASGALYVAVLIDGRAFALDVAQRRITSELDQHSAQVFSGLEGVVAVPSSEDGKDEDGVVVPGDSSRMMQSLAGVLPGNESVRNLLAEMISKAIGV